MNSSSFKWAKKFLESPAWSFFSPPGPGKVAFELPPRCPVKSSSTCFDGAGTRKIFVVEDFVDAAEDLAENLEGHTPISGSVEETDTTHVSPSTGPWSVALLRKAGKMKVAEDDPQLRRSCRMKEQNLRATFCMDLRCIACDSDPPIFSPSIY